MGSVLEPADGLAAAEGEGDGGQGIEHALLEGLVGDEGSVTGVTRAIDRRRVGDAVDLQITADRREATDGSVAEINRRSAREADEAFVCEWISHKSRASYFPEGEVMRGSTSLTAWVPARKAGRSRRRVVVTEPSFPVTVSVTQEVRRQPRKSREMDFIRGNER